MLHGCFLLTRNIEQEDHVAKVPLQPLRVETAGSHIRPTQEDKKAKEERECFAPFLGFSKKSIFHHFCDPLSSVLVRSGNRLSCFPWGSPVACAP